MNLFLLLSLMTSLSVFAGDLRYLQPNSIGLNDFPVPPETSSLEDQKDSAAVLLLQQRRTKEACERAESEASGFATSFFGPPEGPLTLEEASKLVNFQEILFNEIKFFSRILKQRWPRLRPFDRDPQVKPCIKLEASGSYPSGHAAVALVAARTFSMIYPAKRQMLTARAEVIAHDRVLGGVHYPSDIEAGKILGEKIFNVLKVNPEFLRDVKVLAP